MPTMEDIDFLQPQIYWLKVYLQSEPELYCLSFCHIFDILLLYYFLDSKTADVEEAKMPLQKFEGVAKQSS